MIDHVSEQIWARQEADGHWHYPLDDNVTMSAEYIMFLRWMNENDERLITRLAQSILSQQLPDGGWPLWHGGPGNLSNAIECYFALRLAGFSPDDEALIKARRFIHSHGGIPQCRVFTRIWLSLFELYPWEGIPIIPPEIMLAPRGTPFNILEFSYWSRSVIIPLTILFHKKRTYKTGFTLDELYAKPEDKKNLEYPEPLPVDDSWMQKPRFYQMNWINFEQVFVSLNHAVGFYNRHSPVKPLRKNALQLAENWILEHQDESGDWAGIQPAMINSVMALFSLGYKKESEPVRKGLEAIRRITRGVSPQIRKHAHETTETATLQSCVSPVWDTALAALALLDSGVSPEDERLQKAKKWLWEHRITRRSDWMQKSKLHKDLDFFAWCFQYHNDFFPDLDDSTVVLLVLHRMGMTREELLPGLNWIFSMQNSDGGWGTFDRDNNAHILNEIPFADLKSLIDPSNPDVTGHILETLGEMGLGQERAVQKCIRWLKKTQRPDGSWFGRWGVHTLYGTSAVLVGLMKCGESLQADYIQKALRFIVDSQNEDGGWGEDCDNYTPHVETAVGKSTPSQTAWALLALNACQSGQEKFQNEMQKAFRFLESKRVFDGFEEKEFTGTGFPLHFYLRYDGYRNYWPLIAMGRIRNSKAH